MNQDFVISLESIIFKTKKNHYTDDISELNEEWIRGHPKKIGFHFIFGGYIIV